MLKRCLQVFLAVFAAAGTALALPPGVGPLTFFDEFNGRSLDPSKWTYYNPGPRREAFNVPRAITVNHGTLTLKAFTENGTNFTGMISTAGHFEQTYGYFETRARFHTSSGQWSAFWLQSPTIGNPLGDPARAGVEIDVFEHRLHDPFDGLVDPKADVSDRSHEALVWDGYGPGNKAKANLTAPLPGLKNDTWHTYGVSWSTNGYGFYYDDKLVWSETSPVSQRSEFIILSSEIGHEFGGPIPAGGYGSRTESKTDMQISYVRVYRDPVAVTSKKAP